MKKIVIILLIIFCFNFITPTAVSAISPDIKGGLSSGIPILLGWILCNTKDRANNNSAPVAMFSALGDLNYYFGGLAIAMVSGMLASKKLEGNELRKFRNGWLSGATVSTVVFFRWEF